MNRKKSNSRISPKRRLRPISMVHIPIDNQHPLQLKFIGGNPRSNRNIIEQAKTHCFLIQCVMTWRPHQANRISFLTSHDPVDRIRHRAGG
jgi:hypothetical protein